MKEQLKQLDNYLMKEQFNSYDTVGALLLTTFTLPGLIIGGAFLYLAWRNR